MGILNWLFGENKVVHTHLKDEEPKPKYDRMVGEPVVSFLETLEKNPKRYKLEKVLKLSSDEYPNYTCYDWMRGAGHYKLTDLKTGNTWAAYVHGQDRVHQVYGLPFDLNHWELKALWEGFNTFRLKSRERRELMVNAQHTRLREEKLAQERIERALYAKQFQE